MNDSPPELSTLHEGVLDEAALRSLAQDLKAFSTVHLVRPKRSPRARATDRELSVDDGVAQLLNGAIRGLQLRYRHDGTEWCDTLIAAGNGSFRLVRVQG